MYADLERKSAPPNAALGLVTAQSVADGSGSLQTAPAQMQHQNALSNRALMRAEAELGYALNQRAAVVAQKKLAQTLSSRSAIQREESPEDEELMQRKPAGDTMQGQEMAEDELMQQKPVAGSVQGEPILIADAQIPTRTAPVQRAGATVQRIPDWLKQVPGVSVLAAAAGGGGYLGLKTGAALGSFAGPAGTAVGGLVGAAGGALLGGWSALRGKAAIHEQMTPPLKTPLSIPEIMEKRLDDFKKRDKGEADAELQYLEPKLRPKMKAAKTVFDARKAVREHYEGQIATENTYAKDTAYNAALSAALRHNPLIAAILQGDLMKRGGKNSGSEKKLEKEGAEEPALAQGNLAIPDNAPRRVQEAKLMFDKLVARKLPPISSISRNLTPESAMGHEGDLHLGWGSPRGAVLHEFGHHLEHNLLPHEIASVHNFLRARSKSGVFRRVGPEAALALPQGSTGYDIESPALNLGGSQSTVGLIGSAARYLGGSEAAGDAIDRYVMENSDRPDVSYSSKVYGASLPFLTVGGLDTEYLSTTIHFFSDPQTAEKLVAADPLRVSLFLSVAQPDQYRAVAKEFHEQTGQQLDALIHRIGEGP